MTITEEHNAGKDPFKDEAVDKVLANAKKILVASGKKIVEYYPVNADREELLKKVTGRTGNLRAPTILRGDTLYVGFNVELYEKLVSG